MISEYAKSISSKNHVEQSQRIGKNGEAVFETLLIKHNIPFYKSTERQNIYEHTDFFICDQPLDVKGMKKGYADGYIVIEFKNVNGKPGWCSEVSPVRYIAFQFEDCFVIVKKAELLNYCRKNVVIEYVDSFNKCYKKLYTRKGRSDLMTKLHRSDLDNFDFVITLK